MQYPNISAIKMSECLIWMSIMTLWNILMMVWNRVFAYSKWEKWRKMQFFEKKVQKNLQLKKKCLPLQSQSKERVVQMKNWCHSSVGRAKDWKSLCPWFDSRWHHEKPQQKHFCWGFFVLSRFSGSEMLMTILWVQPKSRLLCLSQKSRFITS